MLVSVLGQSKAPAILYRRGHATRSPASHSTHKKSHDEAFCASSTLFTKFSVFVGFWFSGFMRFCKFRRLWHTFCDRATSLGVPVQRCSERQERKQERRKVQTEKVALENGHSHVVRGKQYLPTVLQNTNSSVHTSYVQICVCIRRVRTYPSPYYRSRVSPPPIYL